MYFYSALEGVLMIDIGRLIGPMFGMIGFAYAVVFYIAIQLLKLFMFLFAKLFMVFVYITAWGFGRLFRKKVKNNKKEVE